MSLEFVTSVGGAELEYAVSADVSPDGRHLYCAAWRAASVSVFDRDAETGRIAHRQTVTDEGNLLGVTALRVSPDGRWAVATAFRSSSVVLFERDPESGELTLRDVARDNADGVQGLRWAIDAAFSPDSRFVYVIDPRGPGSRIETIDGKDGAVTVLRVTEDGELQWLESNVGENACFNGARGIAMHPEGRFLYVASSGASALVALQRDEASGRVRVVQILEDASQAEGAEGEEPNTGLAGASYVACSPDGRHVYVSAGRFHGDEAVSALEVAEDGSLRGVQTIFNGTDSLRGFTGGNEIIVSPDGRNVYAAATRSARIACFARDPETGELTWTGTVDEGTGGDLGPAGLGFSPDGDFLYAAIESDGSISIFRREHE